MAAVRPQLTYFAARLGVRNHAGLDADDLLQEGLIAAIASRRTWRADGGASLVTHAERRGRGGMLDAIRAAARHCQRKDGRLYRIAAVSTFTALEGRRSGGLRKRGDFAAGIPARDDDRHPSRAAFVRAMGVLPAGQPGARDAATLYFADGLPMKAIGRVLGMSESRVSQLVASLIEDIRANRTEREAAELLGVS